MSTAKTWELDVPEEGSGGGDFEIPSEDNHFAVCVAVIDLGTQRRRKYKSEEMEEKRMLYLVWELVNLDGNPLIGRDFKVSLHEKSGLRHFVDSWVGAQKEGTRFNVFSLAGKPCLLNVKHGESREGRIFAKVEGAAPLPRIKGKPMDMPAPNREPVALTIAEHKDLPAWMPYLYGRSVKEWLADALELRRKPAEANADDSDEYAPDEDQDDKDQSF